MITIWKYCNKIIKSIKISMYTYVIIYISAITKTMMCPPSFHPNGFVATHAYGQTVHCVSKCMSCHKAIVMITKRAHCFHDCLYIMPILLLRDLSTLCFVDHLWPLIYCIYIYCIYIYCIYIYCIYIYIYTWNITHKNKTQKI